jgi:aryl-alcohol dehydrogenase-like predicted oxidoreductase
MKQQLILGTANFGNAYGIANKNSSLPPEDLKPLITWAQANGLNHFDTAIAYGASEEILGNYLDQSVNPVVDTKLDSQSCLSRESIVDAARKSRDKLGIKCISTLYLHDEAVLQTSSAQEVVMGLKEVLSLGLAKQIGVSVYSEASIMTCRRILPELTVFQVPENICDRRLIGSSLMEELANTGTTFIVRSVFLQGLLLMDTDAVPRNLSSAKSNIELLLHFSRENSLTTMELCLSYAHSISWAKGIVVGTASLNQLKEIVKCSATLPDGWNKAIATLPAEVIDPRNWPL